MDKLNADTAFELLKEILPIPNGIEIGDSNTKGYLYFKWLRLPYVFKYEEMYVIRLDNRISCKGKDIPVGSDTVTLLINKMIQDYYRE